MHKPTDSFDPIKGLVVGRITRYRSYVNPEYYWLEVIRYTPVIH